MGRTIASSIISKLSNSEVYPFYAVDLNFDSSPVYIWTGVGDITLNSNTYTGTGELLQISDVQETQDISAKGMTLSLSGIPSNLLALAINTAYQGRTCKLYLGFMTSWANPDAAPDTMEVFSGYMDQMVIDEGAETSTISTTVESRLIDLEKPRNWRYTHQSQQSRLEYFPNAGPFGTRDIAFRFVENLQGQRLKWGGSVENN